MEIGMIRQIDIDEEMQQSYLDYAMSVIISRALPDARDGLKPVHRRILHAMHAMGMHPEGAYRKSARIVGEVLGKYHPHGDMAVYDAMARMAQPFSMRYPLVDGQGNFGSVDGDSPAAMRYTEAKLAPISAEIMADLEKDTVPFSDNFDGSLREPTVLPSGTPNMLVNGATGIAVGMSTSIPPHNMGEVCTALIYMLSNWDRLEDISVEELMGFIPGPDFPTGGIIVVQGAESDSIVSAYASGRGKITLQARVHIEEMGRGRSRIIVTELPFQTNKSSLIERIAELARSGSLEGLSDLRDESDREGMRIVLELSKNASPEKILSTLYRRTPMQSTFSIIMLALVEGEPRMLTLKQSVRVFLDHRLEVIKRRSEFDLARAKEREHILAGLRIALKNLDEVIQLIRTAKDSEQASSRLQKSFELSEIQARAILDMPLRRLSGLERRKIESEYKEVLARIKGLESLLRSPKKMRALVASELEEIKSEFGDRRRTQIVAAGRGEQPTPLTASDLAPDKETWVVITKSGQVSRTPTARLPRLSGSSAPVLVVGSNTRDTLYLFDNQGHSCALEVHTIPEVDDPEDGKHYTSITPFSANRLPIAGISIPGEFASQPEGSWFLVLATRKGMIKKTDVRALPGPSAKTFISIKIDAKDELGWVDMSSGTDDLILVSRPGMAIRFPESSVRSTGLSTAGVMGIRLDEGSEVVTMCVVDPAKELLLVTESGEVKRSAVKTFPKQGRNGKGVLAWRSGEDVRIAGGAMGVEKDRAVIRFSRGAPRSLRYGDAPRRARSSSGKLLFEMGESNRIREVVPAVTRVSLERGKSPEAKQASGAPVAKKRKTTRKIATKGQSSKRSGTKTSSTRKQSSGKSKTKPSSKKKS